MFKASTVMAKKPYSREQGRTMGESLIRKLGQKPSACWLFCEPGDHMPDLVAGVAASVGTPQMLGCTTDGEISSDGFSTESAVLAGVVSDQISFQVTSASGLKANSEKVGKDLAQKFPSNTTHVQIFSDGLTGNGSAILRGMNSILGPKVTVSGGTAGDARKFEQTWQFYGSRVLSDAAVAISFSGDFHVGTGVRTGWQAMGLPKTATRAVGNVVYELDGEPALQVYKKYLGRDADRLPAVGVEYPLGVVNERGLLDAEDPVLRATMAINERDGSITFAGEIPQGAKVVLTSGGGRERVLAASEEAASLARSALAPAKPAMAFIYTCLARKILLGLSTKEETNRIRKVLGADVPVVGFYTYGEYCPGKPNERCQLHNETVTVTAIGLR